MFGGIPTDAWGRKKTLMWIGVFYLLSAIGSSLAPDPWFDQSTHDGSDIVPAGWIRRSRKA